MGSSQYFAEDNRIHMNTDQGPKTLTNFDAVITKQMTYHDGNSKYTVLELKGMLFDGTPLPAIQIDATEFNGLSWLPDKWGMKPVIFAESQAERHVRTAIQLQSTPETSDIYTHTGWTQIDGEPAYLSGSGAITKEGGDNSVTVDLPTELSRYRLPEPQKNKQNFYASLRYAAIAPRATAWPILLACYRSTIGPSDFAIHLAGRTGTFKSEYSSLAQSHFGSEMTSRNLPASWSSTANALEALAHKAKNALMVIDDFVPTGTQWNVKALQKTADQIIRGQGNQSGRSRLTDTTHLQTTYYPRGLILSTGEDVPEGHSVRARMLITELAPGAIDTTKLTNAQKERDKYPAAMADWIQWLAETQPQAEFKQRSDVARDEHLAVGHSRTPDTIGQLLATAQLLMRFAEERGYLSESQANAIYETAETAVIEAGHLQNQYLSGVDPVDALIEAIQTVLTTQKAHVKTRDGGVPAQYQQLGWTAKQADGHATTYESNGPRIGWIDWDANELLLDPNSIVQLKKYAHAEIPLTHTTLLKRLKEGGMLTRTDESRQRNTVRIVAEGSTRQVIAMPTSIVLDGENEAS